MNESFEKQFSEYLLNPPLEHQLEYLLNSDSLSVNQVKKLIELGVDVNARFEDNTPAIVLAANSGNFDVVKALIEAGADVNAYGETGDFALGSASADGWQEIFDYLLPLTNAKLREEAKIYLSSGKKNQLYRNKQKDQTQAQMEMEFANASFAGNLAVVKDLINEGFNIDAPDLAGNTPLYRAALSQEPLYLRTLIKAGANPNIQCDQGWTPLMIAVGSNPFDDGTNLKEIVRYLIEAGADVNIRAHDGRTPLMVAIQSDSSSEILKDLVSILIEAGANTEIKDKKGNTAILIAASMQRNDIVNHLKFLGVSDHNINQIYLIQAIKGENINQVDLLIENEINVNAKDHTGKTPLIYASMYGYINIVHCLLKMNPDLDIQDEISQSALIWAIEKWHFTIATLLINAGANIHLIDKRGFNALSLAKSFPSKNIELKKFVKFLKEKSER